MKSPHDLTWRAAQLRHFALTDGEHLPAPIREMLFDAADMLFTAAIEAKAPEKKPVSFNVPWGVEEALAEFTDRAREEGERQKRIAEANQNAREARMKSNRERLATPLCEPSLTEQMQNDRDRLDALADHPRTGSRMTAARREREEANLTWQQRLRDAYTKGWFDRERARAPFNPPA